MEIFQVIILIHHNENGVSLIRGVFSKWSLFCTYFSPIITPMAIMDNIREDLQREGKHIYQMRDQSWEIISVNIDEELQIMIDNG